MRVIARTDKFEVVKHDGNYEIISAVDGSEILVIPGDERLDFEADLMGAFGYILTGKRNAKIDELIEDWVTAASK